MIDIEKILKRSWHILWNYRVLWIFGILLAITMGGGGGSGGGNSGTRYSVDDRDFSRPPNYNNMPEWAREFTQWFVEDVAPLFRYPAEHITTWIWIGVAFFLFILTISIIVWLIRYPSETAVMRMVDEYEQSGTKLGFRQGWRLGWSRRAFRLWVIDFILGLPALAFFAVMLAVGVVLYIVMAQVSAPVGAVGLVTAIGIFFVALFLFILSMVFLGLLRNFFARAAALENLGVLASFRQGWRVFKSNWKSAGLMWLVMLAIGIGFAIAGFILFFLFIPVYVIMALPAAIVAFLPGITVFGIISVLFSSVPVALIIAAIVALPLFFMVMFSPLLLVSGWYHLYQSNVWTLTYREIKALENAALPLPLEDDAML
ncbi:MAG: DUF7544 domain-containing protein [Chloroflexota bacterium]